MRTFVAVLLLFGAAIASGQSVQQPSGIRPLMAADFTEIERLYGRSLHDLGTAADSGRAFARSFIATGELIAPTGTTTGQHALAQLALSMSGRRFWLSNLLIEPTAEGALGWPYVVQSRGPAFLEAGLYRDVLVKTRDGWRIRTRTYLPGTTWPARELQDLPKASNQGTGLSPVDYAEIKKLVYQYNVGYDNSGPWDNGAFSIQPFTADAVFERVGAPTRTGLASIAEQSTAHKPLLHHWDSNYLIAVLPDGEVKSFNYDLQFNVDEGGMPVRLGGAGLLHHRYVKTPGGWRIKYRMYEAVGSTPAINWPGPEYTPFVSRLDPGSATRATSGLSEADYIEIEQLYVRNNIAFDSAAEEGRRYAGTFTPDGVLIRGTERISGTRALAAVAAANTPGLHNWFSNLTIEPARGGATGRVYVLTLAIAGEPGVKATQVKGMAVYEDALARTPGGWRFKQRRVVATQ